MTQLTREQARIYGNSRNYIATYREGKARKFGWKLMLPFVNLKGETEATDLLTAGPTHPTRKEAQAAGDRFLEACRHFDEIREKYGDGTVADSHQ